MLAFVFLQGEIGFATLPEHVHRKSAKKGFDFTIMVVGLLPWKFISDFVLTLYVVL